MLCLLFTMICTESVAQQKELCENGLTAKMFIVDTVEIKSPAVVIVTDSLGKFQYFLVDTLKGRKKCEGLKCENVFIPTYKFNCLLDNCIGTLGNEKDNFCFDLKELIQESKAEVWEEFNEEDTSNYYQTYTININTFLVILVRNDFLHFCQSRHESRIAEDNNNYSKIFVPIIWQTTNK